MKTTYKSFQQLSVYELYDILALRTEVFIVEQNCPYQDEDGLDHRALHVMMYDNDVLVSYCRLFDKNIKYPTTSIGRVIVKPTHRNRALGHVLIQSAIEIIAKEFNTNTITISAQEHLRKFYETHGFVKTSETYLEDNIPHIEMLRS